MRARVAAAICARSDFESGIPWFAKLLWLLGFQVWLQALVQPKCNTLAAPPVVLLLLRSCCSSSGRAAPPPVGSTGLARA